MLFCYASISEQSCGTFETTILHEIASRIFHLLVEKTKHPRAVSPPDVPRDASPAEESDALEEVRMAVEQLVIPHQEPVELLPRDARVLAMQAALIAEEYRLEFEETGEGASRRIKILHTYASEGGEGR